jgi:hypothetical protein
MKKIFYVLFVLVTFTFIACGDKDNQETIKVDEKLYKYDSTSFKTEPIEDKSSFQLGYQFDKGEKLLYRLVSISETSQKVVADTTITNKIKQEIIYLIEFEPKSVESDGTIEAEVKIVGLKLNAKVNDEKVTFDAITNKDTLQNQRFAEFYALLNNPFSIRFTKFGEISEIFRVDKISNKFLKLRNADTVDVQTKNMVKDDMINSVLRPVMGQIIRKVTDKTLAKDSIWSTPQPPMPMMVFQINYTNKYKVIGIEKLEDNKLAVIDAGMDYSVEGQSKVNDRGIDYNFTKPVSKGEGKIYFNISKGRIQKSKTTSSTSFSFTMEANTPQGKQKGRREEFVSNTNILELIK